MASPHIFSKILNIISNDLHNDTISCFNDVYLIKHAIEFNTLILTLKKYIKEFKIFINPTNLENQDVKTSSQIYYTGLYLYVAEQYTDMINLLTTETAIIDNNNLILLSLYYSSNSQENEQMIKYLTLAINNNSSQAMYFLGKYYYNIKDYAKMKLYLCMAVKFNNAYAIHLLGHYYNYNNIDIPKSLEFFNISAELNNSSSMIYLANHYIKASKSTSSIKCDDDVLKAAKYYEMIMQIKDTNIENAERAQKAFFKAIINYFRFQKNIPMMKKYYDIAINVMNNTNAMLELAEYYRTEEKDYVEMKKYLTMAINNNNVVAILRMANHMRNIEHNYTEMKELYNKAIKLGDYTAMYEFAYYLQYDAKSDYNIALNHYECVVKNYDKHNKIEITQYSLQNLANYYKNNEKNYDKMEEYYILNCETYKYVNAMYEFGVYCKDIIKYNKNLKDIKNSKNSKSIKSKKAEYMQKSVKYLEMAAVQHNHIPSMKLLASHYKENDKNESKMLYYLHMAADLNDNDALILIGTYYGENAANNFSLQESEDMKLKMKEYYVKSIKNGNSSMIKHMATYYKSLNNYDEMVNIYMLGVANRDKDSCVSLGNYYRDKTPNDLKKMEECYLISGDKQSLNYLSKYYKKYANIKFNIINGIVSKFINDCKNSEDEDDKNNKSCNENNDVKNDKSNKCFNNITEIIDTVEKNYADISNKYSDLINKKMDLLIAGFQGKGGVS